MSAEPVLSDWAIKQWKRKTFHGTDIPRRQRLKAQHIRFREREDKCRAAKQDKRADSYLVKQLEIEAKL